MERQGGNWCIDKMEREGGNWCGNKMEGEGEIGVYIKWRERERGTARDAS
jgi:hypothetical protein